MTETESRFREKMTYCRKCNAPIRFIKTAKNNKWTPVDAKPCKQATSEFKSQNIYFLESGEALKGYNAASEDYLYTSHFSTCPEASHFRKSQ